MASVFSVGSSKESLSTMAGRVPDLEQAVKKYKKGKMDAEELFRLLSDAFGDQVAMNSERTLRYFHTTPHPILSYVILCLPIMLEL